MLHPCVHYRVTDTSILTILKTTLNFFMIKNALFFGTSICSVMHPCTPVLHCCLVTKRVRGLVNFPQLEELNQELREKRTDVVECDHHERKIAGLLSELEAAKKVCGVSEVSASQLSASVAQLRGDMAQLKVGVCVCVRSCVCRIFFLVLICLGLCCVTFFFPTHFHDVHPTLYLRFFL